LGFHLEIQNNPGSSTKVEDVLSRKMNYAAISQVLCEEWEGLQELKSDKDPIIHLGYALPKGFLFHHNKLVLPKNSTRICVIYIG